MKHLVISAVVLVALIGWALTREGEIAYFGENVLLNILLQYN